MLDPKPSFDGVVAIGSLALREQRLALLGGPAAICAAMRRRRLEPDAKAFGFMLDMAADTEEAEAALLAFMDREGVKPDTIMLNMLVGHKVTLLSPNLLQEVCFPHRSRGGPAGRTTSLACPPCPSSPGTTRPRT